MNILQTIFKDHYEEMLYILHPRQAVIDNVDKMINCGDPHLVGQCMPVPNVETSNLCLSDVQADSAQPVVSNTVRTDPIPWPLSLFSVLTATVFLPLTKNSVTFFLRTVLF